MKSPVLLLALLMLMTSAPGCQEPSQPAIGPKPPLTVNVISLARTEQPVRTAGFFGELDAGRSQQLGFSIPGKLKFIAKRGQNVQTDELLAELDLNVLQTRRDTLQKELEVAANRARIPEIQQQIATLDDQLRSGKIFAPFDCVVEEVYAFDGVRVQPQSPVLRIIDSKNLQIKIDLPRKVARLILPEQDVYFVIEGSVIVGRLSDRAVVETAGSVTCRFDIKSDTSNLDYRFGQVVEAKFNFPTDNSGFWLPLTALNRSGEGLWSVLVAVQQDDGTALIKRTLVNIEQLTDELALVDGSLNPGDLVVADGIHRIVPGQQVDLKRIQQADSSNVEGATE